MDALVGGVLLHSGGSYIYFVWAAESANEFTRVQGGGGGWLVMGGISGNQSDVPIYFLPYLWGLSFLRYTRVELEYSLNWGPPFCLLRGANWAKVYLSNGYSLLSPSPSSSFSSFPPFPPSFY
jgi:hypothetical protein